jgi:hypothetical protein
MNVDERAQLLEDIKRSSTMRERIYEQARLDPEFDIAAAWKTLDELDTSINDRVGESSLTE